MGPLSANVSTTPRLNAPPSAIAMGTSMWNVRVRSDDSAPTKNGRAGQIMVGTDNTMLIQRK